jgi:uncharacterized protein Yka (UPF0111/DUF47 family)
MTAEDVKSIRDDLRQVRDTLDWLMVSLQTNSLKPREIYNSIRKVEHDSGEIARSLMEYL